MTIAQTGSNRWLMKVKKARLKANGYIKDQLVLNITQTENGLAVGSAKISMVFSITTWALLKSFSWNLRVAEAMRRRLETCKRSKRLLAGVRLESRRASWTIISLHPQIRRKRSRLRWVIERTKTQSHASMTRGHPQKLRLTMLSLLSGRGRKPQLKPTQSSSLNSWSPSPETFSSKLASSRTLSSTMQSSSLIYSAYATTRPFQRRTAKTVLQQT